MSTKYLNGENIMRKVYDPSTESLKTTTTAVIDSGTINVEISDLNDSIKIGDGEGDYLAINDDGSINVNVAGGTMEIEISAADGDNIAISDGTNTLGITPDGSAKVVTSNTLITVPFDYVGAAYPVANTEIYTYKIGGAIGTTVGTVTVVYTDATKQLIQSVTKT